MEEEIDQFDSVKDEVQEQDIQNDTQDQDRADREKNLLLDLFQIVKVKDRLSTEIEAIQNDLKRIDRMRHESIGHIEAKKLSLRSKIDTQHIMEEHEKALKDIKETEMDIIKRKKSIALLDETIAHLEEEIARIQAEHDRLLSELEIKKRKLLEQYEKYRLLQMKLEEILKMMREEEEKFKLEMEDLERQRRELEALGSIPEDELGEQLQILEAKQRSIIGAHEESVKNLNKMINDFIEHPEVLGVLAKLDEEYEGGEDLTEDQWEDYRLIQKFRAEEISWYDQLDYFEEEEDEDLAYLEQLKLRRLIKSRLKEEETAATASPIKKASPVIMEKMERDSEYDHWLTARGFDQYLSELEGEGEEEPAKFSKGLFYEVIPTPISSSTPSSKSLLTTSDVEYLKRTYGKVLSLALAEIVQVQPTDPIHYLGHWLFKYRYNQEIDEVKQLEIMALMAERERIAAEAWHLALTEEAIKVLEEILARAQDIALQRELDRIARELQEQEEEEYELTQNI